MAIKKYISTKDTTISNAFKVGNETRATGSNMGAADSLEVFALFGQASSSSLEKSRVLVEFPVENILSDRTAGNLPESGSVDFYLNLYNVRHAETLPKNVTLVVQPLSSEWDEGHGKDLDNYTDKGIGSQGLGANWANARSSSAGPVAWNTEGGDYHNNPRFTQTFETGAEDLRINITPLVEEWVAGTKDNYGLGVFITSSQEDGSSLTSYYTKKFSARNSEYFFSRPNIEAVWDSSIKDQRNFFRQSSSIASLADNTNTIFSYNYVRGTLRDASTNEFFVRFYTSASGGQEILPSSPSYPITGSWHATGIYSASFAIDTTASVFYDRWYTTPSGSNPVFTGEICSEDGRPQMVSTGEEWTIKITNLKPKYSRREEPRLRLYTRKRNWSPNIYNSAINQPILNIVEDAYYRVVRLADDLEVIPYGTGSQNHTRLSYDASGSYFDFDMSMLEEDYAYQFEFAFRDGEVFDEQRQAFKFRIEGNIGD